MDYQSVIDFLFNQLANYQKIGVSAYKPGLENINKLLSELKNPHLKLKSIHIAGTNGKGSTSHILASILIENGYKVGLFTSPHIKDFRERIKINGKPIEKTLVTNFITENKQLFKKFNPSFFEITTAMAFSIFENEKCDVCIIETGLGGRLDATNVLKPDVTVITNISLDHTNVLGDSVEQIAMEKAGIIKPKTPLILGEFSTKTYPIFNEKAKENNSEIILPNFNQSYETDLLGSFQQKNIATALCAVNELKIKGWYIDDVKTKLALLKVKSNTLFSARLDLISHNPRVIVDASHNPDGVKQLFEEIKNISYNQLHCIYATSADKDLNNIIKYFPIEAKFYLTSFNTNRSLPINELAKNIKNIGLEFDTFDSPEIALSAAKQNYRKGDLILIFGSFFLLEKII